MVPRGKHHSISVGLLLVLLSACGAASPDKRLAKAVPIERSFPTLEAYCADVGEDTDSGYPLTGCNPNLEQPLEVGSGARLLEARIVGTTDGITTTCRLALRTPRGWFIGKELAECHISAGTARDEFHIEDAVLTESGSGADVLDVRYKAVHSVRSDRAPYDFEVEEVERGRITCRIGKGDAVVECI